MPSPFPGMDPYLEPHWRDIHACGMVYSSDAIQPQIPTDLIARVQEDYTVDEEPPPRHIEILDARSGNRLVTAIEFLSPSNKIPTDGRELYLRQQQEYLHSGVNLVEVDLLRAGYFTVAFDREKLRAEKRTPYVICVRRAARPREAEVYPATYREPLPTIRIPLRPSDADVTLNLQSLIAQCYRRGRYATTLNYALDADPPLPLVEAQWADRLLREAGVRQ